MGDFDILCQTTVPLSSYNEPDDFVVKYRATIQHDGEPIGEAVLYKVLLGLACNYGQHPFDIFDAHSDNLLAYYEAVFDPETGDIREVIDDQFECTGSDLLIVDSIVLERKWRGLKLGLLALRRLIDLHETECRLVVCQPYPLENADTPVERREGKVKLRRYFKNLGFRRIGRTDFYGLSTTHIMPKFEDVLRGMQSRERRSSEQPLDR